MLLHPESLDLEPRASDVLARLEGDPRFKPELPAAQLELLTTPVQSLEELAAQLAAGRRDLAAAAEGIGVTRRLRHASVRGSRGRAQPR